VISYAREFGQNPTRFKAETSLEDFYKMQLFFKEENEKDGDKPNVAKGEDVFSMFSGLATDM